MISANKKYKIALIGFRLSGGGSDKVMATLSLFFEKNNIEVHNIIVLDEVSYRYAGKLVNLGKLKNDSNGLFNKFKRMYVLRKYLKAQDFDFIIDFRFRTKIIQELLLSRWIYNAKTIFTVHSYLIDHYMPNIPWLTRLMYNHCYANVAIVPQMRELIETTHGLKNLVTIANPVNLEEINDTINEAIDIDFDYIIAIGQYENPIKQFDKLIVSYAHSVLVKNKIHLLILGNGDKKPLLQLAEDHNIADYVHFLGYQVNPFKYLKKARFLALTSENEGFANVLVESLACQTPAISFDCPCGPSTIIIDKYNGLLVENQSIVKFTEAMDLMITDEKLYLYCKQNALQSITPFLLENIGKQWLDLMKIETPKN